ncbi:thermonuclease family protein [Kingella potus]|uniref:thermonuclease family protein n=1 Tax=Kingella potus TaxID=265175 RepID=UPI002467B780|nr:thermonuclease family protein [Kingella potus]
MEAGAAWHYVSIAKKQQDKTDYAAYAQAEAEARRSRAGLWQKRDAVAPWKFRWQQRRQ